MITRYDMTVAFHGSEYFPEAVLSSDGEFVAYDEHEAAMQRNVETHAANLAAVEARARQMEQTIARVQALMDRWVAQRLKETLPAAEYYGLDPEERLRGAWWIRELRAVLEGTVTE